jgi:hypothetical protein
MAERLLSLRASRALLPTIPFYSDETIIVIMGLPDCIDIRDESIPFKTGAFNNFLFILRNQSFSSVFVRRLIVYLTLKHLMFTTCFSL